MEITTLKTVKSQEVNDLDELSALIAGEYQYDKYTVNPKTCVLQEDLTLKTNGHTFPITQDSLLKIWNVLRIPKKFSLEIPKHLVLQNVNTLFKEKTELLDLIVSKKEGYLVDAFWHKKNKYVDYSKFFSFIKGISPKSISNCRISENHLSFEMLFPQLERSIDGQLRINFGFKFNWNWVSHKVPVANAIICLSDYSIFVKKYKFKVNRKNFDTFKVELRNFWPKMEDLFDKLSISSSKFLDTKQIVSIWRKLKDLTNKTIACQITKTEDTRIDVLKLQNKSIEKVHKANTISLISIGRPNYPDTQINFLQIIFNIVENAHNKILVPSYNSRIQLEEYAGNLLMEIDNA